MEAHSVTQSRLMGALLVEKELITDEQLEQALARQDESGDRLGEILVAEFGVSRLQLAGVLTEQWAGSEKDGRRPALELVEPLTPAEVRIRRPLGELLVERGLVTAAQLEAVLDRQRKTGARVGEILVEQGVITLSDLADVLAEQAFQPVDTRGVDPQPSQSAVPIGSAPERAWSADDRAVVAGLEERLRAVERTAGGTPWQEDLRLVAFDIRAAISAVEGRLEVITAGPAGAELVRSLEAVGARVDALESAPVSTELDAFRRELEELKLRPAAADEIAALRAELERLESLPHRADEISHLAGEIAAVSTRLDEIARVGELSDRLEEVAELAETARTGIDGLAGRVEELVGLESRLDEVAKSVPSGDVIEELRRGLAGSVTQAAEGHSEEQAAHIASLAARLDQLASRVDEVAAAPVSDLAPRIDLLSARVDEVAAAIPAVKTDNLAVRIELLEEEVRADDGTLERLATEIDELGSRTQERLDTLAAGIPSPLPVDELRAQLDRLSAVVEDMSDTTALDQLGARLDEVAAAASVAQLETRMGELEDRVPTAPPAEELHEELQRMAQSAVAGLGQALQDRVDAIASAAPREDELRELRSRLDEVAARPLQDQFLEARVDGLAARLAGLDAVEGTIADLRRSLEEVDGRERDGAERISGLGEELNARVGGLAEELGRRVDEVARRADGLLGRDEAAAAAAAQAAWVQRELDVLREWADARAAAVDAVLAAADEARLTGQLELGGRVDEAVEAIRAELVAQGTALGTELEATVGETAELCARVDALQEAAADSVSREARLERRFEKRLDELAARFSGDVAGARADAERAMGAVRQETGALAARIDELHGLRHLDSEAAKVTATEMSARLESLGGSLHAEAAAGRAAAEHAAGRIEELHGLRADDLAVAELAGAELAARLDDHAMRSAAAALDVEQALRAELGEVANRLEERDAGAIEAREELRGEMERVASSVGWRLERIEESLASGDKWVQLEEAVTELRSRLEEQAAIGSEQVRATERALRKGLASLGEKLADTESTYVDAGNALRRSIERLGAAVVEADARMADQIPVSEAEGCVAFAPTPAGYRLVELPGAPPELGATIEVAECEGPLVVTRYGRSPLPLDSRPCAYLDRA